MRNNVQSIKGLNASLPLAENATPTEVKFCLLTAQTFPPPQLQIENFRVDQSDLARVATTLP